MTDAWPALCALVALALLLILIIRFKLQAFVALLVVSLGLGLATGMSPERVLRVIADGMGDILSKVTIILALGAMLGRILDASGAAEVIARTLVGWFGVARASTAVLLAAFLIGIPILFNVGFLLLIPIMWRLQRETGRSLLWFVLPLAFSLGITHSLIPPKPGIVGTVNLLGQARANEVMIETILFGTLLAIPMVLVGWFGPGQRWARRQFVTAPADLAKEAPDDDTARQLPSFSLCVLLVTLPLFLSLLGFGTDLLDRLKLLPGWMSQVFDEPPQLPAWLSVLDAPPKAWLKFLGNPVMALLVPTGLAFLFLGMRRGLSADRLGKLAGEGLVDVGSILFLFGAAGAFSQVIQVSGAGDFIANMLLRLPLSPVLTAYLVAVLMRVALGSATAAILLASSLLVGMARGMPGQETLLVLAVANGVTFMTQPADSGFWMVKEYCNLSVRDVMVRFNTCRIAMSLTGLGLLLAYAWLSEI
jgi:gluconate transporter